MTETKDQIRGHCWTSICRFCEQCKRDKQDDTCTDTECVLHEYITQPWAWRSWDVYKVAHALLLKCWESCGPCYPICQNFNSTCTQCGLFRGKQSVLTKLDAPKNRKYQPACRPITGQE